jgi:hypothetical protein
LKAKIVEIPVTFTDRLERTIKMSTGTHSEAATGGYWHEIEKPLGTLNYEEDID